MKFIFNRYFIMQIQLEISQNKMSCGFQLVFCLTGLPAILTLSPFTHFCLSLLSNLAFASLFGFTLRMSDMCVYHSYAALRVLWRRIFNEIFVRTDYAFAHFLDKDYISHIRVGQLSLCCARTQTYYVAEANRIRIGPLIDSTSCSLSPWLWLTDCAA